MRGELANLIVILDFGVEVLNGGRMRGEGVNLIVILDVVVEVLNGGGCGVRE
jgi:hypothetical protein